MTKNAHFHKSAKLYPVPRDINWKSGEYIVGSSTKIVVQDITGLGMAEILQDQLGEKMGRRLSIEVNSNLVSNFDILIDVDRQLNKPEGYTLMISNNGIRLTGSDPSGVIFGIQTLLQILQMNEEKCWIAPYVEIKDWPRFSWRGIHIYLPARESIEGFKRIIKMLSHLKMNTLFIEVGAGMEYERHPEINKAWEKFCRDAYSYPGGPQGIQQSEAYWKDSIHPELAGGSYLTKKEVRNIVQYAKKFGFKVVPEIQALSHAYYLCIPHREIAERPQEPFPDTYCPSNPDSFKLYFDVAEEIIEVFDPEWVSIGHDEVRILAECPLCKDKTGEQLLADEINKLYDFYHSKGIRLMMWGEKLQNFTAFDGIERGGVFEEHHDQQGRYWRVPATYKAIDMIPKDILMLDWYHYLTHDTENKFYEKGFYEIFGNFSGSLFADWNVRSQCEGLLGAEISTWCLADEYTIARNNTVYEIVFSADMLWTGGNLDSTWEEKDRTVIEWMPIIKSMLQNSTSTILSGNIDVYTLFYRGVAGDAGTANVAVKSVEWMQDNCLSRIFTYSDCLQSMTRPIDKLNVPIHNRLNTLIFLHAAALSKVYFGSHTFKDLSDHIVGAYEVRYEDGSKNIIDIQYGIHIGHIDMDWGRTRNEEDAVPEGVEQLGMAGSMGVSSLPPYYRMSEGWRGSLLYFTFPVKMETDQGTKTAFAYEWLNPHPEKQIQSVHFIHNTSDPLQKLYLLGIAGSSVGDI